MEAHHHLPGDPHHFPKPHTDVLEQFIDYQAPLDKYSDLARFDGSVVPERTKGEISARCDIETMNFLALTENARLIYAMPRAFPPEADL